MKMVDSDLDLLSAAVVSQKLHAQKRKLKQKREPNWTLVEKETLRNICLDYMDIINNRRTDNEMCGLKNRTWVKITDAMRESGYSRNVSRVREAYARMKKVDKGVVVLQLPTAKLKDTSALEGAAAGRNDLRRLHALPSLCMARDAGSGGGGAKYYSEESESDESNDSPLAKRLSLPLRRKSSGSLSAGRETMLLRRTLGELQLKPNSLSEKEQKQKKEEAKQQLPEPEAQQPQQQQSQSQSKKLEQHFELENINLKAELDSSHEEEQHHDRTPATQQSPARAQSLYAEPEARFVLDTLRANSRFRRSGGSHMHSLPLVNVNVQMEEGVAQLPTENEPNANATSAAEADGLPMQRTAELDNEAQRKAELHRYQMSAEEKRLALLDLQLEQVRLQMRYERHLYEKDLEAKQFKLELMRRYKK